MATFLAFLPQSSNQETLHFIGIQKGDTNLTKASQLHSDSNCKHSMSFSVTHTMPEVPVASAL